jgi:hypothetical protein
MPGELKWPSTGVKSVFSAKISQENEGKENTLSFASRELNSHEINYTVTDILALVFGVRTHG